MGDGIQVAPARARSQWIGGGLKLTFPVFGAARGANVGTVTGNNFMKDENDGKHEKRQRLLRYVKRSLRKSWFFRLLVAVVWKCIDYWTSDAE